MFLSGTRPPTIDKTKWRWRLWLSAVDCVFARDKNLINGQQYDHCWRLSGILRSSKNHVCVRHGRDAVAQTLWQRSKAAASSPRKRRHRGSGSINLEPRKKGEARCWSPYLPGYLFRERPSGMLGSGFYRIPSCVTLNLSSKASWDERIADFQDESNNSISIRGRIG